MRKCSWLLRPRLLSALGLAAPASAAPTQTAPVSELVARPTHGAPVLQRELRQIRWRLRSVSRSLLWRPAVYRGGAAL